MSQQQPQSVDLHAPLLAAARRWLPRILTQICRDPTSPLYGCADRNWWHYKIRDFSSIILQQAGYALHQAAKLPEWQADAPALDAIAAAGARFWNDRAQKHYAFEEYYPWEQGYPPLAFATLAAAKLVHEGVVPVEDVRAGLRIAARQLRTRFEDKAANQQVAGLAALAWVDKVLPDEADPRAFAAQRAKTLALQHDEGWYWEYDGPDLGYLAVTIDCLWDLHDATGDADFRASIARALAYMAEYPAAAPNGIGLHNSRNTDYLVPYGIVRSALEGEEAERGHAAAVAIWAFGRADRDDHTYAATDDRYICHYIGHSVLRALALLGPKRMLANDIAAAAPRLLDGCGHYLDTGLIVSARKGGIVTLTGDSGEASDFGWIVERGRSQYVTHWWSPDWTFRAEDGGVAVEGRMFSHREKLSTPFKHIVLRVLSFLLGRRLIAILKRVLIFKRGGKAEPSFARRIRRVGQGLEIIDRIHGMRDGDALIRAPRASKRHVASADSFQAQDLGLLRGYALTEDRTDSNDAIEIITRIAPR